MNFRFAGMGTLVIACMAIPQAIAGVDFGPNGAAQSFVRALQQREFDHAAAMFVPDSPADKASIAASLERLDEQVGGLSTIHRAAMLPKGKSIKVSVQARPHALESARRFDQVLYVGTARDGQTVYYQIDLTRDGKAQRVLAFAVDLPASDAQSEKRSAQLARAINP